MTERLFFALWPNNTVRQAINATTQPITQDLKGKIVALDNWHITLAFLGDIDEPTKHCMQQIAASIQASRFNLSLDIVDYWPKPRVLWLGASETPLALQNLVNIMTTGLQDCGYRPETRPFQAHLTLMRKANQVKTCPTISPIAWTVDDFCLVRSTLLRSGTRYEVIKRWPLKNEN